MLNIFSKLFDLNQKEIDRLLKVVDGINELESDAKKLKDKDFVKNTEEFKKRIGSHSGEDTHNIIGLRFFWKVLLFRRIGVS